MSERKRTCEHCKWWSDSFSSVCVNVDSPFVAEFVDRNDSCEKYEEKENDGNYDEPEA